MKDNRVLLAKDIEDIYTKVLNTYLAKGYSVNINSMSGTQGELSRIDVTNGTDIYRISLNSSYWINNSCSGDKIVLTVEKFEGRANNKTLKGHNTIWNGSGKTICTKEWFAVDNKNKAYTDLLSYAIECQMLNYNRRSARGEGYMSRNITKAFNLSDESRAIVADICRRTRGYMRIKDSDVKCLEMTTCRSGGKAFTVYFNNGKSALNIANIRG